MHPRASWYEPRVRVEQAALRRGIAGMQATQEVERGGLRVGRALRWTGLSIRTSLKASGISEPAQLPGPFAMLIWSRSSPSR